MSRRRRGLTPRERGRIGLNWSRVCWRRFCPWKDVSRDRDAWALPGIGSTVSARVRKLHSKKEPSNRRKGCRVGSEDGPRDMKDTLRSKLFDSVEPYLTNGVTQPLRYRQIINDLHTAIVGDANRRPPDISPEEELLPRTTRCTLSQLRSGH